MLFGLDAADLLGQAVGKTAAPHQLGRNRHHGQTRHQPDDVAYIAPLRKPATRRHLHLSIGDMPQQQRRDQTGTDPQHCLL
ncbi:hypothetical protein D3C81_1915790 [compost metagenome]